MIKSLNLNSNEFPEPFGRLNALLKILKAKKGYRPSARKTAVDAINEGLEILIKRETESQPADVG